MMLLALYPQFRLWNKNGNERNSVYSYNDIDEVAYTAYLQALIDGRPRKNDPYTGRDNHPKESLFSIQFATPYMIALPARLFGLSASTAMIITSALSAFFSALALFWLIKKITNDEKLSAVGALIVLCLGTLAAGEGAIYEITNRGIAYPFLPFLRRYVPAVPFPFFFAMCAFVWCALKNEREKTRYAFAFLAVVCFAFQVYSYFFLWTVAFAWLAGLFVLWILSRPENFRRDFELLLFTLAVSLLSLVPYAFMLANRSRAMDDVQLLTTTHKPDLLRLPELISYAVIIVLLVALIRGTFAWKNKRMLFVLSFALVPFMAFNQQIITGYSLQPIHYQVFGGNYVALLSVILCAALFKKEGERIFSNSVLILLALVALVWGVIEVKYSARVLDEHNLVRNEAVLVEKRLAELAKENPKEALKHTTLNLDFIQADDQPTFAPQPVLWSRHQHIFAGVTWEENKERFYQLLYYAGLNEEWLAQTLYSGDSVTIIALFGWGRITNRLTANQQPLTQFEVDMEIRAFANYIATFDRERAAKYQLHYVITRFDYANGFERLDHWYERDEGERIGKFILYRVKLRE